MKLFLSFIILIGCVSSTIGTQAQTLLTDSTVKAIVAIKDDSLRAVKMFEYADALKYANPDQAVLLSSSLLENARYTGNKANEVKSYRAMGKALYSAGNFPMAMDCFLKMAPLADSIGEYGLEVEGNLLLADIYENGAMGDSVMAYTYLQQALQVCRQHNVHQKENLVFAAFATYYGMSANGPQSIAAAQHSIAVSREIGDKQTELSTLTNMAYVLVQMGNTEEALKTYAIADKLADSLHEDYVRGAVASGLTTLYSQAGRYDLAEKYANQGIALARKTHDYNYELNIYHLLSDQYRKQGRFEDALAYADKYTTLNDSIFTQDKQKQLNELQTKYDTKLKDERISSQNEQLAFVGRKNTVYLLAIILLSVVIIGFIAVYHRLALLNGKIRHQQEELIKVNGVKDRLFSIISHDLRTPVNSLMSFSMMLDRKGLSPEKLATYTTQLKGQIGYTAGLLENLLQFSRSQLQGYQVRPETVDIAAVVEDIVAMQQPEAVRKNITVNNNTEHLKVKADAAMLALIVRNLLSNAIKFTHHHGSIILSTLSRESKVCLKIQDSGTGMASVQVAQFNESKEGTLMMDSEEGTDNEPGTGLGLQLCSSFAKMMGGRITAESELGKGTTFTVCLPGADV